MGLFSKLKEAFFEEEEVEIDEPIVRKKEKVEEPIAHKIEVSELKEEETDVISERDLVEDTNENTFPMIFDDDDFKTEEEIDFDKTAYNMPKVEPKEYNSSSNYESYHHDYKEEVKIPKKSFRPSLNISPVYGIIEDKDEKNEEIVIKKEVRITIPSNKLDIDIIREKAYGDLTGELDINKVKKLEAEKENVVYDMNNTGEQPIVDQVTIGDASEYFEDLGLQYNVDYKDRSHEEATGRSISNDINEIGEEEQEPAYEIYEDKEKQEDDETITNSSIEEDKSEESIEDNLFDLIDSMYEDKE